MATKDSFDALIALANKQYTDTVAMAKSGIADSDTLAYVLDKAMKHFLASRLVAQKVLRECRKS